MYGRERTFLSDTLVVDLAARAFHFGFLHLYAEVFLHEIHCREYRQIGITLAATWATIQGHLFQRPRRHQITELPRLGGEWRVACDYRHKDARADGSTTGTHITASTARHLSSATHHFQETRLQVNLHCIGYSVVVSRQQSGSYQHMVLRTMHVTERLRHHLLQNSDRVFGGLCQTQGDDGVHAAVWQLEQT